MKKNFFVIITIVQEQYIQEKIIKIIELF